MTEPKLALRRYQELMVEYALGHKRCALFAGMGLGKTVSTLTALSTILTLEGGKVLVLAPKRVAQSTWPFEAKKWEHIRHLRVMPVLGSATERRDALRQDADIYTMNYDNLVWLVEHYGDAWPFTVVVADESTRLKSFRLRQGGKRAQALAKVAHTKIERFILLTGTPAPNGLLDLWGQTWMLDAGQRLGRSFTAFKDRWFVTSYDGFGSSPQAHAQAEIQAALGDICLTLDPKDWFDLNDPIVTNLYVDLPREARKLYKDMEKQMFLELDGHEVEAFSAAAKTQKLLQLANGSLYLPPPDGIPKAVKEWRPVHEAKLDALDSIIAEANGMPVLVAYHFVSDLARLKAAFPQGRQLDANSKTIADWNAGKIPILFAHPQSAGHGLNLQDGGNILVFFGHNWNLEDRLQIIERIGPVRQLQAGYNRPVYIYNILARDTVDELVLERVQTKREVQDILLDALNRHKRSR